MDHLASSSASWSSWSSWPTGPTRPVGPVGSPAPFTLGPTRPARVTWTSCLPGPTDPTGLTGPTGLGLYRALLGLLLLLHAGSTGAYWAYWGVLPRLAAWGLLVALAPGPLRTHITSLGLADWLLGCLAAWLLGCALIGWGALTSAHSGPFFFCCLTRTHTHTHTHTPNGAALPQWVPWGPNHWPEAP